MNTIIPDSINDRISVLFTHINNLYKTLTDLTANFFIINNTTNTLTVTGDTFTIDTTLSQINLGSQSNPDSMLIHGTGSPSVIDTDITPPNGSLYLTQNALGEAYLKINGAWVKFGSGGEDLPVTVTLLPIGFTIAGGDAGVDNSSRTLNVNANIIFPDPINEVTNNINVVSIEELQTINNKFINLTAGTTGNAPLKFTSGENLSTPIGGAIEYDGTNYFASTNTQNTDVQANIRKIIFPENYYRTNVNKTINVNSTPSTISDIFPYTKINLDITSYYLIEWHMFLNNTGGSTSNIYNLTIPSKINYCILYGLNFNCIDNININYVSDTLTNTVVSLTTTSLSVGKYYHILKAYIDTTGLKNFSAYGEILLQVQNNSAQTLLKGSYIKCIKLPDPNTVYGSFIANGGT